jgi:hypothetical protein
VSTGEEPLGVAASRLAAEAVSRLRGAGLADDEVLAVLERRLGGPGPKPPADLFGVPVGATMTGRDGAVWRREPNEPGAPVVGTLLAQHTAAAAEAARDVAERAGVPQQLVEPLAGSPLGQARPADEPGEPPVGSVVTDNRSRVCWRDGDGWWRSGMHVPITWTQVCQAVGGPEQQPMPGLPTIVSSPPARAQGPTVVRPAGSLELPMQVPVLGEDGQALVGPNGQPMLRTETETITISEVVPAGGAR